MKEEVKGYNSEDNPDIKKVLATSFETVELARWPSLDDVDHMFAGEPQEEGMMQYRSSFRLITKPRFL